MHPPSESVNWLYRWILVDRSNIPAPTQELRDWRIIGGIAISVVYLIHLAAYALIIIGTESEEGGTKLAQAILGPIVAFLLMFTKFSQGWYIINRWIVDRGLVGRLFLIILSFFSGLEPGFYIGNFIVYGFGFNDAEMLKLAVIPAIVGALLFIVLITIVLWNQGREKLKQKKKMQSKLQKLETQVDALTSENLQTTSTQNTPSQVWVIDEIADNNVD